MIVGFRMGKLKWASVCSLGLGGGLHRAFFSSPSISTAARVVAGEGKGGVEQGLGVGGAALLPSLETRAGPIPSHSVARHSSCPPLKVITFSFVPIWVDEEPLAFLHKG